MLSTRNWTGRSISFRLVEVDDADYIHALRDNPNYGRHLSSPAASIDAQKAWIRSYKKREAEGLEYYFLIERKDNGNQCGVVRLYDIHGGFFTWGSWILDSNKPAKAALDSALLIYRLAFGQLDCHTAEFDVRRDNDKTLAFHRRFGAIEIGHDDNNVYFRIEKLDFASLEARLNSLLYGTFEGRP